MSRFREEVKLIRPVGWAVAALLYAGLLSFFVGYVYQTAPDARAWPLAGKVLFAVFVPLPLVIYALLIAYVNGDARRRGMRRVMWTLLAVFVPNGIGIILYFIMRDPLPVPCPACGAAAGGGFAFCPACGTAIRPACPQCHRGVERHWANCAHCGAKL